MPVPGNKKFAVGDWVEVRGLVNAKHLNGKMGEIVKGSSNQKKKAKQQPHPLKHKYCKPCQGPAVENRLAILFPGDSSPKLIRTSNLQPAMQTMDDAVDDPRIGYASDGSDYPVCIEKGSDKTCVDCGSGNLQRKYHVLRDEVWRCEEHYVDKYGSPGLKTHCVMCHDFVGLRQHAVVPDVACRPFYTEDHVQGKNFRFQGKIFLAHRYCWGCNLCGTPYWNRKAEPKEGFIVRKVVGDGGTFMIEAYCAGSPGTTSGCSNEYEAQEEGLKRLQEIENLSVADIQSILSERSVPFRVDSEEKDSLVRKLIVTDKEKGSKATHILTTKDAAGDIQSEQRAKSRLAPGYDVVDKRCKHGSIPHWEVSEDHRQLVSEYITSTASGFQSEEEFVDLGGGDLAPAFDMALWCAVGFWAERKDMLQLNDLRDISKILWGAAVHASISETGETSYAVHTAAGAVIINAIIDVVAVNPQLSDIDLAHEVFTNKHFKAKMKAANSGVKSLFQFMHSPKQRKCDCMKYVVTATEIGMTGMTRPMQISQRSTKHCNRCTRALAAPALCSLCKEVAYCGAECQREDWPQHKIVCRGHLRGMKNKKKKKK